MDHDRTLADVAAADSDSSGAGDPAGHAVATFDVSRIGRLGEAQAETLRGLHETMSRDLAQSWGKALNTTVELTLAAMEYEAYQVFLELETGGYLAATELSPVNERLLLRFDRTLAFLWIDLRLGGAGQVEAEPRELTEIEAQILQDAVLRVNQGLKHAWAPLLDLGFSFIGRRRPEDAAAWMPPEERILVLTFALTLAGVAGRIQVGLPPPLADALLRKMPTPAAAQRGGRPRDAGAGLRERLLETTFPVELVLPGASIPARDLLSIEIGQILSLPHAVDQPAWLVVGGRKMFSAMPVSCEATRGAQILERVAADAKTGKEAE